MSKKNEKIFENYKSNDFNGRLHMYLQYPELRNDFIEIDRSEMKPNICTTKKASAKKSTRFRQILNHCLSWCCE